MIMPINGHNGALKNGNGSEKNRYSDEELEEFRQIILAKLDKARNELIFLNEAISGNPHGTDDTSRKITSKEENSNEVNEKQAFRQEKFIDELGMALVRIENKSYGICMVTGKLISKARLRIVPHATLSIEAKLNQSVK